VTMNQHLIDMKQRTLELALELKGKANVSDVRKLKMETEHLAHRDDLTRLIESTNKLRDALGERMDDITERMWGMRNEGESNLTSSTGALETRLQGALRTIESLEGQQRAAASLIARLEKELLSKVTYPEVGTLKREVYSQVQDVQAMLHEEVAAEREKAAALALQVTKLEAALADRATTDVVTDLHQRMDLQSAQLAQAHAALAMRATGDQLAEERRARQGEVAELRALLETKVRVGMIPPARAHYRQSTRRRLARHAPPLFPTRHPLAPAGGHGSRHRAQRPRWHRYKAHRRGAAGAEHRT